MGPCAMDPKFSCFSGSAYLTLSEAILAEALEFSFHVLILT